MTVRFLERLEEILVPHLYGILLWAVTAAGFILLTKDLWRGMGIAAAYSLYNIFANMYQIDMQEVAIKKLERENGKSTKT